MRVSIRTSFAALLWLVALVPPALYLLHRHSPSLAFEVAGIGLATLRWSLLGATAAALLALVAYPPFLPSLRLAWRRLKARLRIDPGPLLEAQARLQHFENAQDHLTAGRCLREQGQPAAGARHLARAVELDPSRLGARHELGLVLLQIGDLQGAAEQLAQVVATDERHAFGETLLALGTVLERGGANARAVEALARHEELFGESRRNQLCRARSLARLGRDDEAIELLHRAARPPDQERTLAPEDALARARARVALLRRGRR